MRGKAGSWLLHHKKNAKAAGGLVLLGSTLVLGISYSIVTSVFTALTSAMTVFSVLIIMVPLFSKQ